MAIAYRSTDYNSADGVTSLSVNAPSGTTTGDVVAVFGVRNASGGSSDLLVDNNGGTPFTRDIANWESGQGFSACIFTRRIQGGDPSSYSFTFSGDLGATRFSLVAVTFSGPNATDIYDATPSMSTASNATSVDANSVNCSIANGIHLIFITGEAGDASWNDTTPSGYTFLWDASWFYNPLSIWYKAVGTGATGAQTLTAGTSSTCLCYSMIFKNTVSGYTMAADSGLYTKTGTQSILRPGSRTILKYRK